MAGDKHCSAYFSGLVTYYLEGPAEKRGNIMQAALGKAELAWGFLGNIFYFLLPWESVLAERFCESWRWRSV